MPTIKQYEQLISVKENTQTLQINTSQQIIQLTNRESVNVLKSFELVQVYNNSAPPETGYVHSFAATSGFTVLGTTHQKTVKGIMLLDDQHMEMLANVTINQTTQDVIVQFGINQTGTLIIH
jgi:hypothetical protein